MLRILTVKGRTEIEDFNDLTRWAESLLVVDEVYRLMRSPDLLRRGKKIDFRQKDFKDIEGVRLVSFRVSSPPEIVLPVDNFWLGALIFVIVNYKDIKENVAQINSDANKILTGIQGLASDEIQEIDIGIRLFVDKLLSMAESDVKGLLNKIHAARSHLNFESIVVSDRPQLFESNIVQSDDPETNNSHLIL